MTAYYNEHDATAAAWLRELIKDGHIAKGDVDERSIVDVQAADVRGFIQCHWFAGIGGWSYALRLANWPDDRPVWTGSCPCQPFSAAGANLGGDDPRHLWPAWFRLIRECRPQCVFGEQVESALAHGWLDLVCDDLEREGYAVGACGLPASSVGAFHIRQRLWFVAQSSGAERGSGRAGCDGADRGGAYAEFAGSGDAGVLAEPDGRLESQERTGDESGGAQPAGRRAAQRAGAGATGGTGLVADALDHRTGRPSATQPSGDRAHDGVSGQDGATGELADAAITRREAHGPRPERPWTVGEVGVFGAVGELADADGGHAQHGGVQRRGEHGLRAEGRCADGRAGDTERAEGGELGDPPSGGQRIDRRASGDAGHVDQSGALGLADSERAEDEDAIGPDTFCEYYSVCHNPNACGGQLERCWLADAELSSTPRRGGVSGEGEAKGGLRGGLGDSCVLGDPSGERFSQQRSQPGASRREVGADAGQAPERADTSIAWADVVWLPCRDGKARPTQPGLFPLADGVSGRVGLLRGYGNAIVPQVAQAFITAYLDIAP